MSRIRPAFAGALLFAAAASAVYAACPTTLFAPSGSTSFGNAAVLTGDLNADGFGDWAVASQTVTSGPGRVYVYRGGAPRSTTPSFTLTGAATGDRFGASVAAIGDWNRDGWGDLAVGAPFDDNAGTDAGRVYVYYGGPAFDAIADRILNGPVPGGRFGTAVAGGADLNQDGGADLVGGAPLASIGGFEGKVFVYYGNVAPSPVPSLTLTGAFGEQLGVGLAVGDLNGDGVPDLAAGAPGNTSGARTKLFWGGAGFDGTADRTLIVAGVGSGFGEQLSIGDVNGDAQPDLVGGAPTFGNGLGAAYVFYGGPASDEFPDLSLALGLPAANFGRWVTAGQDLNGDGYGDFAVGVPGREVRIYNGGPGVDNVPDQIWLAEVALDGFGSAGSMGPDTDGNGTSEMLVGAPLLGGTGRAYLEPPLRLRITAPAQLTVAAGQSLNLHLCVHNDESTTLPLNIHVADDQGWMIPFDASVALASGDSVCYDLPVLAAGDASCAAAGIVTISAGPPACPSPTVVKTVSVFRTVTQPVITTCALADEFPEPGNQAELQFCFQNVTQATRTYVYETSGWAGSCALQTATVTVAPGAVFCTTRSCQLPVGALCGDVFTMLGRVRDQCSGTWVQCSKTLTVTATSAVTVVCAPDTTVDFGQVLHRRLRFINSSSVPLAYNFSASDAMGWGPPQAGSVTLNVGQTHTVDYVLTTPSVVCAAQNDAITLSVASTACPARASQCVSQVVVPFYRATVTCPVDTAVGFNTVVKRRAYWQNDGHFQRTYDYALSDTRGWGAPVTGTVSVLPGQWAAAVITLQVPGLCLAGEDSVKFQLNLAGCPPNPMTCVSRVITAEILADVTCADDFLAPAAAPVTKSFLLRNMSLAVESFVCTITDSRGWGTPVVQPVTLGGGQTASIDFTLTAPMLPLGQFDVSTITFQADDAVCHHLFTCTALASAGATPPGFEILAGPNETNFGEPLATTRDLLSDGVGDLVAGAQSLVPAGSGRLHVEFGGPQLGGAPELAMSGETPGDGFATVIAGVGDLNGDGFGDFAVAAPLADTPALDGGRVYVHFGGFQLDQFPDRTITGTGAGGHLGEGLAGLGDVNGDGYDDLGIGLPGLFNGLAFVYFGGPLIDTNPDRFLSAQSTAERFGTHLARGGDLNGDGYKDFLVAAPSSDVGGTDFGAVYVYFGGPALDGTPDLVLPGDGGRFGDAITAADFDGDGWPDIIAAAPLRGVGGRVTVFRGGPGLLDAVPDWVYDSAVAGEQLGFCLSAGDIDFDGDADLTVGTQNPDGTATLRVLVFAGGPSADQVPDVEIVGLPGTRFGAAVVADRDMTGDGYCDVLVGASEHPPNGRVFIYATLSLTPSDVPQVPPAPAAVTRTFLGEPREDGTGVRIEYVLERNVRDLRLEIFDIAGRRIRNLERGTGQSGRYALTWDRRDASGVGVRRGVYLVRLRADEFSAARKAVVARP